MSKNYVTSFTKYLPRKKGDNEPSNRDEFIKAQSEVYKKAVSVLRSKSDFTILIPDSKLKKTPMAVILGVSMVKGYLSTHNKSVDEMIYSDMTKLGENYPSTLGRNIIKAHMSDIRIPHYRISWDMMFTCNMESNHANRMQYDTGKLINRYIGGETDIREIGYNSRVKHTIIVMGNFASAFHNTFATVQGNDKCIDLFVRNMIEYLQKNQWKPSPLPTIDILPIIEFFPILVFAG